MKIYIDGYGKAGAEPGLHVDVCTEVGFAGITDGTYGTNHPVGIPDRIVIYFPNRIVSWNNPQHLVKFQDRMVNPVHYMKFLIRFVFVSNDFETDVYDYM